MAGITKAQAEAKLQIWLDAEDSLARNQSYEMPDGRKLTRADLKSVGDRIAFWDSKVKELDSSSSSIRIRRGVPRP